MRVCWLGVEQRCVFPSIFGLAQISVTVMGKCSFGNDIVLCLQFILCNMKWVLSCIKWWKSPKKTRLCYGMRINLTLKFGCIMSQLRRNWVTMSQRKMGAILQQIIHNLHIDCVLPLNAVGARMYCNHINCLNSVGLKMELKFAHQECRTTLYMY